MSDGSAAGGWLQRILAWACEIEARETRATLGSFLLVFLLMGSYYILRPVRDALASDWSDAEVSWLWTITFFISTIAVSLYGAAVSKIRFQRLVPSVYGLFAASFILFYFGEHTLTEHTLLDKAFYLWVSLFSLFHISVFWSFMADTFSKPQATRLFGFIGAGASAGGIVGPATASLLVGDVGTDDLLLIASAMVTLTLPLVRWLQLLKIRELRNQAVALDAANLAIGGNPLAGFAEFLRSGYLLAIGLFLFLYTSISAFVYFEMKNLLDIYDTATRTQIWANMDLAVNSLTILVAVFATGRMAKYLGMP
nr:MFS transporter [Halioglobus sp.]